MLTVHHLNNSRSQRILWLLEELGVEYEIRKYERELFRWWTVSMEGGLEAKER